VVGVGKGDDYIGVVIDGVVVGEKDTPSPRYVWVLSRRDDVVLGDFVKIADEKRNVDFVGYISELLPKSRYGLPLRSALDAVEVGKGIADVDEFVKEPVLFLKVTVLKTYDRSSGALGDPIRPIMIGLPAYYLDGKLTQKVLGLELSPNASINVGTLYVRQGIPVLLNPAYVLNHIGIWGMQGSGKSETATVLVEELVKLGWAVVLFDFHGEYRSIDQSKGGGQGLRVKRLVPGVDLRLELPCLLEPDKAKELLVDAVMIADEKNPLQDQGVALLRVAYDDLIKRPPQDWRNARCPPTPDQFFRELMKRVENVGESHNYSDQTIGAVIRRLDIINDPALWGGSLDMRESVLPGFVTLIDLSGYITKVFITKKFDTPGKLVFAEFIKRLVESKYNKEVDVSHVAVVIDEAGEFFPPGDSFLSGLGVSLVRQVRKMGIGIILIAQSPGYIHPDIVKQIKTHIMFRTAGKDLDELRKHVGAEPEVFEDLKALNDMVAYIYGQATRNTPIKARIREPRVRHMKFLEQFGQ
jgi:DNA helicase HerA-like ATPase